MIRVRWPAEAVVPGLTKTKREKNSMVGEFRVTQKKQGGRGGKELNSLGGGRNNLLRGGRKKKGAKTKGKHLKVFKRKKKRGDAEQV